MRLRKKRMYMKHVGLVSARSNYSLASATLDLALCCQKHLAIPNREIAVPHTGAEIALSYHY